ncbi:hypothetical protein CC86DRAFT_400894 [Ophiobolus disseminans]|uniref:Uncharacterized protein n=1 Tax=Ophiobolus disseminans TaxID=1469910 RepID=A0A6A7AHC6_9PLEO|nr:hypothetical protein CC86DRAFT_400894 [Ophiobolus disseminans]
MTSPQPLPDEMQSLHVEFSLPMEPRTYEQASDEKSCRIFVVETRDRKRQIIGRIDEEADDRPYRNEQWEIYLKEEYKNDPNTQLHEGHKEERRHNAFIVYIKNFFTDGRDFAYYIVGRLNWTSFFKGTFGMQAWGGPLNATPMLTYTWDFLSGGADDEDESYEVLQTHSPTENLRWKYLFETARIAWSKLIIDPRKVERLRKRDPAILGLRKAKAKQDAGAD